MYTSDKLCAQEWKLQNNSALSFGKVPKRSTCLALFFPDLNKYRQRAISIISAFPLEQSVICIPEVLYYCKEVRKIFLLYEYKIPNVFKDDKHCVFTNVLFFSVCVKPSYHLLHLLEYLESPCSIQG